MSDDFDWTDEEPDGRSGKGSHPGPEGGSEKNRDQAPASEAPSEEKNGGEPSRLRKGKTKHTEERNEFGTKAKSARRKILKKGNEHLGPGNYPATPKASMTTNEFRSARAKHAALSLLTDESSQAWHAVTGKRRKAGKFQIEDAAELEQAFFDYCMSVSERPFVEKRPTKDGGTFCTESELPVTQAGLCAFVGMSVRTWHHWKNETHGSYRGEEFADTMEAIETKMFSLNLEKGLTGELAPNLMGKFLGIVDKSEVTHVQSGTSERERNADLAMDKALQMLGSPKELSDVVDAGKAPAEEAADGEA